MIHRLYKKKSPKLQKKDLKKESKIQFKVL